MPCFKQSQTETKKVPVTRQHFNTMINTVENYRRQTKKNLHEYRVLQCIICAAIILHNLLIGRENNSFEWGCDNIDMQTYYI